MSKYDPLRHFLAGLDGDVLKARLDDIEGILGFALPRSARRHPAWWANTPESHSQAQSWLGAGWRTWVVKLSEGTVEFHRLPQSPSSGVAEAAVPFLGATLTIPVEQLTLVGASLIERYAKEEGGDVVAAVSRALQEAANARRRAVLDEIARSAPQMKGGFDVVQAIRDDRESH